MIRVFPMLVVLAAILSGCGHTSEKDAGSVEVSHASPNLTLQQAYDQNYKLGYSLCRSAGLKEMAHDWSTSATAEAIARAYSADFKPGYRDGPRDGCIDGLRHAKPRVPGAWD